MDNFYEGPKANSIQAFVAPSYGQYLAQLDSHADTETLSSSEFSYIPTQSPLSDTVKSDDESEGIGESETPWMYEEFQPTPATKDSSSVSDSVPADSWVHEVDVWICNSYSQAGKSWVPFLFSILVRLKRVVPAGDEESCGKAQTPVPSVAASHCNCRAFPLPSAAPLRRQTSHRQYFGGPRRSKRVNTGFRRSERLARKTRGV